MRLIQFPNESKSKWIDKYNELMLRSEMHDFEGQKLTLHHIIPRSIDPSLKDVRENWAFLPFKEHMDAHYYLWKYDKNYASQLWFGCVYGRKHNLWNLPGGEAEYSELKRDVREYRKRKEKEAKICE